MTWAEYRWVTLKGGRYKCVSPSVDVDGLSSARLGELVAFMDQPTRLTPQEMESGPSAR